MSKEGGGKGVPRRDEAITILVFALLTCGGFCPEVYSYPETGIKKKLESLLSLGEGKKVLRILDSQEARQLSQSQILSYRYQGLSLDGKTSQAIEVLNKLIILEPEKLDHLRQRAYLFQFSKEYDKALADFDKLLKFRLRKEPKADVGWDLYERSNLLRLMKQDEKALNDMIESCNYKDSRFQACRGVYDLGMKLKKPALAVQYASKLIEQAPDDPGNYLLRAKAYCLLKKKQEAMTDLSKVLKLSPEDWKACQPLLADIQKLK